MEFSLPSFPYFSFAANFLQIQTRSHDVSYWSQYIGTWHFKLSESFRIFFCGLDLPLASLASCCQGLQGAEVSRDPKPDAEVTDLQHLLWPQTVHRLGGEPIRCADVPWKKDNYVLRWCYIYIYMIIYEHIKVETVTKSRIAKFEWKSDLLVSTHAA